MNLGNTLVVTGLAILFVAIVFEYLSLDLSGMAIGATLALLGFVVLGVRALRTSSSPDRQTCDDCGSANDPDAVE
ncbi:hypothetical protein AArcSl_3153 [Halalkaliarchaeum desulfuricum]|uniref:Uncharacterized protein n=1 Tax=Halalkaliarchaeum desulfuricum TaxID=2055893 RepID=A0A343TNT8_9EURY|nr:hypothetical protein [Halalkaliarchaeum desulfuricum]AUX10760.1 hypothetical protein AArcSl_3153 [Halalkaliarchaeum desulfuricum]